jgi:hypothetical protein
MRTFRQGKLYVLVSELMISQAIVVDGKVRIGLALSVDLDQRGGEFDVHSGW